MILCHFINLSIEIILFILINLFINKYFFNFTTYSYLIIKLIYFINSIEVNIFL